jgi:hypothetical protein
MWQGFACDHETWLQLGQVNHRSPERLALIPAGQEHILKQEDGKKRRIQVVTDLSRGFSFCAAGDEATKNVTVASAQASTRSPSSGASCP